MTKAAKLRVLCSHEFVRQRQTALSKVFTGLGECHFFAKLKLMDAVLNTLHQLFCVELWHCFSRKFI